MAEENLFDKSLGNVCVIGGCGFLGHHIVELVLLRHPQSTVSILDLRDSPKRNQQRTTFYACDITDEEAVNTAFQKAKPDVVIHTASPTAQAATAVLKELMYKVNITGTQVLLKAAQECGVRAFVYTSSASVIMGEQSEIVNADERWPVMTGEKQPDYYAHTKGVAETSVLAANRNTSTFLTCALRPAGIFGEGDVQAIPGLITASRKGQSKFQVGPNDNLFDWSYVGNIAHAHLLAAVGLLATSKLSLTPLDTERIDGETFFITNDSPIYFWDFARLVWKEGGDTVAVDKKNIWVLPTAFAFFIAMLAEFVMGLLGKVPNLTNAKIRYSVMTRYYCISKAKQRLGYAPIVGLEEGIRRGVGDYLEREKMEREKMEREGAAGKKVQ
ncbi:C-3 sterol dehydrogenase/C-4 decarboxylase family protein [Tothia fuscella]|uniref:Sterol-4-alpha-carboxylate 3-dehydrogenase ERG26, decarboxylating n=1 Tax=Tothia fuscella TaxID=1048955 RepID=A0A9P4P484_9PEZI|nr:C-3 sterol dehydrogenase/C-4 decarboxylase family protein [Tothia fuscella]